MTFDNEFYLIVGGGSVGLASILAAVVWRWLVNRSNREEL